MREEEVFVAVTVPIRSNRIGISQIVLETGYQHGLQLTGCNALTLSTALDPDRVERLFEMSHGLLLTGGEDLEPGRYGEDARDARDVSPQRDALEAKLAAAALEREIPVLAICRGMQLLNVLLGGDLYQDLAAERDSSLAHDRFELFDREVHEVRFEDPRWLKDIVSRESVRTNSAHHQGVKRVADPLRPVAWAEDGLVEAVEYPGEAWTVGVQWHPERSLGDSTGINAGLFRRFGNEVVRTARARGRSRPQVSWSGRTEA